MNRWLEQSLWRQGGALVFVAGLLYLFSLPSFYVGWFSDDASYILLAKALLHGKFIALESPNFEPVNYFPPGYPFFLAPFVKCFEPHWSWLKIVSVGVTLGTIVFAWLLLGRWQTAGERGLTVALYALNPLTVQAAGTVMSDMFFLFLVLVVFWLLSTRDGPAQWLKRPLIGVLLGWACLVRSEGFVLMAAIGLSWLFARRWADLVKVVGVAFAMWSLWIWRWLWTQVPGHMGNGLGALSWSSSPWNFFINLGELVPFWLVNILLSVHYSTRHWYGILLSTVLTGLVLWLIAHGFRRIAGRQDCGKELLRAAGLFCTFYIFIHCVWSGNQNRYCLAVLPFLLAFMVTGAGAILNVRQRPALSTGLATLMLTGYLSVNLMMIRQLYAAPRPLPAQRPQGTFDWIRTHVPKGTLFSSSAGATLYLHTNHQSGSLFIDGDEDAFRYRLLQTKIGGIWLQPNRPFVDVHGVFDKSIRQRRILRWVSMDPSRYRPVYISNAESSFVYQVIPSTTFCRAYDLFLEGNADLAHHRIPSAMAKLDLALDLEPDLPAALNAYATGLLAQRKRLPEAEAKWRKILQRNPDNSSALLGLEQLYLFQGHSAKAREVLRQAHESLQ